MKTETETLEYIGVLEFATHDGDWGVWDIVRFDGYLYAGAATNNSFIAGYRISIDDYIDVTSALSELGADLQGIAEGYGASGNTEAWHGVHSMI